jgi:halocyanin-like protein
MSELNVNRRRLLAAGGTALTISVAGCLGGGGGDDDGGNGGDNGSDNGGEMSPEETADSYLNDNNANNYGGTGDIVDETGTDSVTIEVGPGGNFQFNPAAVRVDSGTTVTWEWLSNGHSVEQTDSDLDFDGSSIQNEGATHEETLESSGVLLYQCGPHATQGHHGAIIIE